MEQELTRHQRAAQTMKERYGDDHFSNLAKLGNTPDKPRPTSFKNNVQLARKAGLASAEARRKAKKLKEDML